MLEESEYYRQQNSRRTWFIALSVAVGCCVVFSVMMIYFVTTWGKTLNAIDNRLANLEMRGMELPSLPPSAAAVPIPGPEIPAAPLPETIPVSAAAPSDTVPVAPPPSNEAPPTAKEEPLPAAEPQMSVPPDRNVFIPAPLPAQPPQLP
jgi:hypothetical protein